ncbi:MAG: tryptophan synthase subunit alpha [Bacteroidetes bacterium]|nr:tryptophan synthase subunit alpha [Bacteroidota bacterium]MBI3482297.1 tryptophan synthase subunit alpha [Bacteroidota bacterium]
MNRITHLFSSKAENILSVFYTAGFPNLSDTISIARELERAGADIIEIGIPFSDPVADGPVIQESNKIALDNGMNLKLLLKQVKEIRQEAKLPIILMGYLNPVLQYGIEKFCSDAAQAGVDGVILPDLPLHEFENEYKSCFEKNGLLNIFLISPTTSESRIREIDAASKGFIYSVSASSTTGAKGSFSEDQVAYFKRLQSLKLKNPQLIGFGISNYESFAIASKYSSGAIIGSAFIQFLKSVSDFKLEMASFINSLRARA